MSCYVLNCDVHAYSCSHSQGQEKASNMQNWPRTLYDLGSIERHLTPPGLSFCTNLFFRKQNRARVATISIFKVAYGMARSGSRFLREARNQTSPERLLDRCYLFPAPKPYSRQENYVGFCLRTLASNGSS